jgi:hypothetical protein
MCRAFARYARAPSRRGQGDYEDAFLQASRINPSGTPSSGIPGFRMVMDLVEAAVRTGRIDEARAHVAAAKRAGSAHISPRTALTIAGATALAARDDDASSLLEAALSLPEADRWPFEQARIQLAYGQWLRRTPRENVSTRLLARSASPTCSRAASAWRRSPQRTPGRPPKNTTLSKADSRG